MAYVECEGCSEYVNEAYCDACVKQFEKAAVFEMETTAARHARALLGVVEPAMAAANYGGTAWGRLDDARRWLVEEIEREGARAAFPDGLDGDEAGERAEAVAEEMA